MSHNFMRALVRKDVYGRMGRALEPHRNEVVELHESRGRYLPFRATRPARTQAFGQKALHDESIFVSKKKELRFPP